jgi:hypothetical protein
MVGCQVKLYLILMLLVSLLCVSCGEPREARARAIQKKHGGYGHVGDANRKAP